MKKKKIAALFTALALLVSMTACGGQETATQGASESAGSGNGAAADTAEASGTEGEGEADPVLKDGEMTNLVIVFPSIQSEESQIEKVEQRLNEIIAPYIDATVDIQLVEWGAMNDQYNLMLSSGDDVDLMFTIAQAKNYESRGQLQPLEELMQTYAPTVYEEYADYWDAFRIRDEIYGMPTFAEHYNNVGLVCRTDILTEMGIEPEAHVTDEELNDLFARVKEKYPDMYMLTMADDAGTIMKYYPFVMDSASVESGVGILQNEDGSFTAVNMYASDEYREMAEQAYEWQQLGYIVPDVNTTESWGNTTIDQGNVFGYIASVKPGYNIEKGTGHDIETSQIYIRDGRTGTGNYNVFQWVIPTNSDTPEKAMAFFELWHNNPEMMNLFCYGIENEDYEILDAENGIIGYGDNVTAEMDGWRSECYMMNNSKIAYVWDGNPADYWDVLEASNEEATLYPYFGFIFNTDNVRNEITAIANVTSKYVPIVENGLADPATTLQEFNQELEAAGIQKIIDEMQTQVDAWAAENK